MPDLLRYVQPSFAAGRLSAALRARIDLAKYAVGLAEAYNVFIHAHGGVSNRAGTRYICDVKDHAKKARLIGFEFNDRDSYALEFGEEYLRAVRNGGQVLFSSGPDVGQPFDLATDYQENELFELKFKQSLDVVSLAHVNHAPAELKRFDHDDWTITDVVFSPLISAPATVTATPTDDNANTGDFTLRDYKYKVSAIAANGEESLPSTDIGDCQNVLGLDGNYNDVTWSAVAGAVKYVVYKESNGLYGFIGQADGLTFRDDNISPNLGDGPQGEEDPFEDDNFPNTVFLHEQRRGFAGSALKPSTCWLTQSANYKNFNVSTPAKDDDAVTFTIVGEQAETIRHGVSLEDLILFGSKGEWKVTGTQVDDIITPSSVRPRSQSYFGCSHIRPLVIGSEMLFVQRDQQKVYNIAFSFQVNRYQSNDLTILAQDLLETRKIVDWAYAQTPFSVIWVVCDDGTALSLTYLREHEVWAWAWHETKGKFESVTCVPENGRTATYFTVRRKVGGVWKRFIERMDDRKFTKIRDAYFVDCGLSHDDPKDITAVTLADPGVFTSNGHGFANGTMVRLSDIVGLVDEEGNAFDGRYLISNSTTNTFRLTDLDGNAIDTSDLTAFEEGQVRQMFQTFGGFEHLIGEEVVALADGNAVEAMIVDEDGEVTLPYKAAVVHIGLPYYAEVETLDIDVGQPTNQGVIKQVASVKARFEKSRGMEIGPTRALLTEPPSRDFEGYEEPAELINGFLNVNLDATWKTEGTLVIRQSRPLPMTLLSVVPQVIYGDD